MAKIRSRRRLLPFDFCHLNFGLLVFAGGESGTLPLTDGRDPGRSGQAAGAPGGWFGTLQKALQGERDC
jgi:hypothetical protein